MNSMHETLARELVKARLATARQEQLARRVENDHGVARRWAVHLRRHRPVAEPEATVTTTRPGWIPLEDILSRTAEHIVARGTSTETATLCAMSSAAAHFSPGAAAALVDWAGSETARLRAFGIVHVVILRDLTGRDRSRLLRQLTDTGPREAQIVAAVEPACVARTSPRTGGPVGDLSEEAA